MSESQTGDPIPWPLPANDPSQLPASDQPPQANPVDAPPSWPTPPGAATPSALSAPELEIFRQKVARGERNFARWSLARADLHGMDLRDVNFYDADLSGANLASADLSRANLGKANLSGANLRGANLSDAFMDDARLDGADTADAITGRPSEQKPESTSTIAAGVVASNRFCVFCGTALPGVALFCANCGKQQPKVNTPSPAPSSTSSTTISSVQQPVVIRQSYVQSQPTSSTSSTHIATRVSTSTRNTSLTVPQRFGILLLVAIVIGGGYLFIRSQGRALGATATVNLQNTSGTLSCTVLSATLYQNAALQPASGSVYVLIHVTITTSGVTQPANPGLFDLPGVSYGPDEFDSILPDGSTSRATTNPSDDSINWLGSGRFGYYGYSNGTEDGYIAVLAPQGQGFTLAWWAGVFPTPSSDSGEWDIPAIS